MSINMFGYCADRLQKTNLNSLEGIKFNNGETKVLANAKLFLDTNKQLEDFFLN